MKAVFRDKVTIMRTNATLGAIITRLIGIRAAKGEVVVNLDSHMEVQKNW